jgi:hypothetical protein
MKPRNKFQVRVDALSKTLWPIAKKLEPWAFKNCIEHIGHRNKMWTSCLSCGHVWPTTSMRIKTEICEGCGFKLKLTTTRKLKSRDWARFCVFDVVEEFQVVRFFEINCLMKAKEQPRYYTMEIMQHWIMPDGKFEIRSTQVGGMGMSYDHFCGGEITLKDKKDLWKYNISVYKVHPEIKLMPVYKRNGLTSKLMNLRPFDLLKHLPNDAKTETLLKTGQMALLAAQLGQRGSAVYRFWPSVKICIRQGYTVKDATAWLDYLDLLDYFRKDLRSATYVCPHNLKKEHDRLVEKKRQVQQKRDLEQKRMQAINDEVAYQQAKAAFFGLVFKEKDVTVKVLESVQEFVEEGDTHKHCVFTNSYYKKEDSLIFSAKVDGKSVETIEVSLSKMDVVQSRGLQNSPSPYHQQILDLVRKNMNAIVARSKEFRREVA